jgi:hypothetical protein
MLTGRVPFMGESPLAVLVSHLTLAPPRASEVFAELPPALDEPILKMLHKEPSGRPPTAGAAVQGLIDAANAIGLSVPDGMPHLPRPPDLRSASPGMFAARPITPSESVTGSASGGGALGRSDMLTATDPAPNAKRRPSWALVAIIVALGAGVVHLGRSTLKAPSPAEKSQPIVQASAGQSAAAPRVTEPPLAAPPPVQPAAEPARSVSLMVRGAPPGARVLRGDEVLGDAGKPIALPFGTARLELTVAAPGYESQRLDVTPDRDIESDVKLKRHAARPKRQSDVPKDLESPF